MINDGLMYIILGLIIVMVMLPEILEHLNQVFKDK